MRQRLDEAKSELIEKAAAVAERSRGVVDPVAIAFLMRRYYRHVAAEDLVGRLPVDVYGAATSHRQLAEVRKPGTTSVRVFTPTVEEHGWSSGHSVVEVVTDDMPFLVDSVTMELTRQDRGIHLVVHPQFAVHRDQSGRLKALFAVDESDRAQATGDTVDESWIHVEIDRETEQADLDDVRDGIERVLRDVRDAVEDWPKMHQMAVQIADDLAAGAVPAAAGIDKDELNEGVELLRWLADEHFTFLGYREYVLSGTGGDEELHAVSGSGLGILRLDRRVSVSFAKLPPDVRARAREKHLLVLTKANSRATVHRAAYLDYVGVKAFDSEGNVVGERRFLGLLSSGAYTESVLRVPVLRRKVRAVMLASGFSPGSHSGKDLIQILETYPRDELFQASIDELLATATSVLHLQERRQLRLFVRRDVYGRYLSCLVYLPRDRYNTKVRTAMQDILLKATDGESADYTARISESVLARLHFVIRMPTGVVLPELDIDDLEAKLTAAIRVWNDDFADALVDQLGEQEGARLLRRYGDAFTEAYKEDFAARTAVADLRRLEALTRDDGLGMNLYQLIGAPPNERRFKLYRSGSAISLTEVLPVLSRLGVEVVDEWPYEVSPAESPPLYLYDFGLRWDGSSIGAPEGIKERFQDAFEAVWRGRAENDGLNALVLRAGLTWRQVLVLRAYAKYLRQAGTPFSHGYLEECLVSNPGLAGLLIDLFEARFDPDRAYEDRVARAAAILEAEERIEKALDAVESLDQDRILRSFLGLIQATLRTNHFQLGSNGQPKEYRSFKFDAQCIQDLPQPRPKFEIWVHSPAVEGVHLRFGKVARGGLRWSDRKEDFRTEILGLVKAQAVKNAVIVPVGAKGGFVAKRLPDAATAGRDAWLAGGVAAYKTFISALLDVTDNRRADGTTIPPPRVVRHDGDDSYLVVAADKGTATFSDIANSVSAEYGFWLGDAFASGGSAGYDHKVMGITARGAWESVKRHFREMGRDSQSQDFTCIGIGDMSGDVFGNGMLLSRHIRLIGAFDHRHIFLDPNPDAETSFAERERLFALPRSSWADYAADRISAGGGVYPRSAKSVPISAEVRAALGLDDDVSALAPAELMRAVLCAPVDLLWNGGIGTYVKSSTESHTQVGDKANDAIRVNGIDLRCAAVGEGGNLGFTQLGRIEYARFGGPVKTDADAESSARVGGRINTDAIDNSAGVDTSDHEVNIKILLDSIVAAGDLTSKQRNEVLASMTDDVARLVLTHNYAQNRALATAAAVAPSLLHVHGSYMRSLESRKLLSRPLEFLPTDRQLTERGQAGQGLTSPELAVLLEYTKNILFNELFESQLPDDPYLHHLLVDYFPAALEKRFGDTAAIDRHPLRREIVTSQVVNRLVDNGGITFIYRLAMESGATTEELARAHVVAQGIFDVEGNDREIADLDTLVDAAVQTRMLQEVKTLAERATRWLVVNRRPPIDIAAEIEFFADPVRQILVALPDMLLGREKAAYERRLAVHREAGVPLALASRIAALPSGYFALGVVGNAKSTGTALLKVAELSLTLSDSLGLGLLLEKIIALPRSDRWQTMARAALRDDLHGVHAQLVAQALESTDDTAPAEQRVSEWEAQDAIVVERSRATLREIVEGDSVDLARLSVGLRVVRALLRAPVRLATA